MLPLIQEQFADHRLTVDVIADPELKRVTARVKGHVFDSFPSLTMGEPPQYYEAFPLQRLEPAYSENPRQALRMYAASLAATVARHPAAYVDQYGDGYRDHD